MRKIVFIGNCQGRRLQELYRDDFAYLNGDTTEFLFIFEPPSDRVHQLLRGADVIVAQALDSEHALDIGKFETTAKTIWYPNVTGIFLWPFSGAEHIYNRSLPYYAGGPYEFGDRWLNRKIETGIPPADIVSEYLDLDLAKAINLDRMYELHIDRARQRDARTGFDITSVIERRLTEEKLFMVPANLELPLFLPLARGVYERLGMPTGEIDRVLASLWRTPFPAGDLPIHPSIARHFGLKFVTAETRYRFCTGEQLTFIEWLERYVRFEWNDALLKATSRAGAIGRYDAEAEATLNLLRKGLEASTGSVTGYASLTHLLLLKGEKQAALEAFLRFEAFDPTNPSPPLNIAHLLAERGELEEAERRIHEVTLKWPLHADAWLRLAVIRERRENGSGAVDAIRRAVALDPRNVHLLTHFVHVIHCYDPAEDPFQAFNNAIGLDPNNTAILVAQARAETDHRRFPEAVAHIDRAIRLEPDNVELLSQKADILIRSGDLAEAEATVAKALELKPYDGRLFETRADLLIDLGRHEDAVAAIRHAVNLDPDKVPRLREIGDRLAGAGRFAEAARFYREAIERDWNNAELFSCLGHVLSRQGDAVSAVLAFYRAIQLNPRDERLYSQLAGMMIEHRDFAGAEQVLEDAIRLAPADRDVLGLRALLFMHLGRLPAALEAVEEAVAIDPGNPHLAARRALILSELGDYSAAERILDDAIAASPSVGGFHALRGTVLLRQGRKRDARFAYHEALRCEPDHTGYRSQLEELADV